MGLLEQMKNSTAFVSHPIEQLSVATLSKLKSKAYIRYIVITNFFFQIGLDFGMHIKWWTGVKAESLLSWTSKRDFVPETSNLIDSPSHRYSPELNDLEIKKRWWNSRSTEQNTFTSLIIRDLYTKYSRLILFQRWYNRLAVIDCYGDKMAALWRRQRLIRSAGCAVATSTASPHGAVTFCAARCCRLSSLSLLARTTYLCRSFIQSYFDNQWRASNNRLSLFVCKKI